MNNSTHVPTKTSKSTKKKSQKSGNGKAAAEHAVADAVPKVAPERILVIDLGGTKVKVLATGETEVRKAESGPAFSPANLVETVEKARPGVAVRGRVARLPGSRGTGWPEFRSRQPGSGLGRVRLCRRVKNARSRAERCGHASPRQLRGGRMLFLGLGTGLGSTLISQNAIVPLELGGLRYSRTQTLGQVLGREGLRRIGKKAWRAAVASVVHEFISAFEVEYVVLGGGNSKEVKDLPAGARLGHNQTAFRGGFRLWNLEDVKTLSPGEIPDCPGPPATADWRIL